MSVTVGPFRTAGVDLSSQDKHTALAEITWRTGGAAIELVHIGVGNDEIIAAAGRVALIGIDCPLGWPRPFTDLLVAARAGAVRPDTGVDDAAKQSLAYRLTDVEVRARTGRWPLSVSADRIAYPAMRCAGLLGRLLEAGKPMRRSGITSIVAEVYPAAALRGWDLATAGYKSDPDAGARLLDQLAATAPWLTWESGRALAARSHDAFDAVVCALVAGAVRLGRTTAPAADQLSLADEEGWIHLPDPAFLSCPTG